MGTSKWIFAEYAPHHQRRPRASSPPLPYTNTPGTPWEPHKHIKLQCFTTNSFPPERFWEKLQSHNHLPGFGKFVCAGRLIWPYGSLTCTTVNKKQKEKPWWFPFLNSPKVTQAIAKRSYKAASTNLPEQNPSEISWLVRLSSISALPATRLAWLL